MRKKIDVLSVTSSGLQRGDYKNTLPELYALKSAVENNPWHLNQNVFDHTVAVFAGLEKVLKLRFLKKETKEKIEKYLKQKIGSKTRKEILIIATLLHDLSKTEAVVKDPNGSTRSPGHEIISSVMVKNLASRFDLDKKSEGYVRRMVHCHGFVNDILTLTLVNNKAKKYFSLFKQAVGDIYLELLLFMYADILGCDLKKADPKQLEARTAIITSFLERNLINL